MLEKMFKLFGWTNGQKQSFYLWRDATRKLFGDKASVKRMLAVLLVAAEILGASVFRLPIRPGSLPGMTDKELAAAEMLGAALFKMPIRPLGDEVDLTGYDLVVYDEFDGDALDEDLWYHRGVGPRRLGFNAASQVQLTDGNLILTGEYRDADSGEYGEGWYTGAIALREWYCKGYFEIRCICNKDEGFWSAFWLQSSHSYDTQSKGGVGGAEIDIFEASEYDKLLPRYHNCVTQTVWCNGTDDDDENLDKCQFNASGDDIYETYNTYGLKWTDDEYIFYINGRETYRTSFGLGVSEVLENLIVSLEIPDELPEKIASDHDYKTQMIVDYVKVYQLPE